MSQDAIQQFVQATGTTVEKAIQFLSICDNNVNLAVECYVDQNPTDNVSEEVRAPIPSRVDRVVEERVRVGRTSKRPGNVFDRDQDRNFRAEHQNHAAKRKLKGLAELFKPPSDISFVGTLEDAKFAGKRQDKWLLVNVQDVTDFQCQVLNRDLWCKPDVRQIIGQYFIFWQLYRDSLEAQHFMRFYQCETSPFICIIDPRTGEQLKSWTFLSKSDFISETNSFLSENVYQYSPTSPPSKRPCTSKRNGVIPPPSQPSTSASSSSPGPSISSASDPGPSNGVSLAPSIVKGEIIRPVVRHNPDVMARKAPRLDPTKLHITFRLPCGSRETIQFDESAHFCDLYTWLYKKGFTDHVIRTQFPSSTIVSDSSSVRLLGRDCNRIVLYVEEND